MVAYALPVTHRHDSIISLMDEFSHFLHVVNTQNMFVLLIYCQVWADRGRHK